MSKSGKVSKNNKLNPPTLKPVALRKVVNSTKGHNIGHRKRMKSKFLEQEDSSFLDVELLEVLLYLLYPRNDVKQTAHKLIKQYHDLNGFILATNSKQDTDIMLKNFGESITFLSKLSRVITKRSLVTGVRKETVLSKWSDLMSYLKLKFGYLDKENFSVIYLDYAYKLIDICEFGVGTIDESVVYIREIVKTGLIKNAKHIVLCHNHLSGSVKPSQADIDITNQTIVACKLINIEVLDHVIVSKGNQFSFSENGLMR
ncbi:MAG: DNA repair protein RadC [Alphaproteobacteria bacterium]|nr:DNA repair protein RadC [Rickettsiales bacterium]